MATNPYVNKVQYGDQVLIDLTADTVTAGKMLSGTTAHDKSGASISGTIQSLAATTYNVSSSNQTIASGKYISGAQTIRGVITSGITSENIRHLQVVKVGDSDDDDRVISVTGTFTSSGSVSQGQIAAQAGDLRQGYSAFLDGAELKGSMPNTAVYIHPQTVIASGLLGDLGHVDWNAGYLDASGSISGLTLTNEPTGTLTANDYADISDTDFAPVLVQGGYLYVTAGYASNVKISLAKLVPDGASAELSSNKILSGYSAYNNDGVLIAGNIPTKVASDVTVNGATVTIPSGYYSSQIQKSVASGAVGTPTATKGTVSNNSIAVTPSVTNITGYITGGTLTGTAVTVTADELTSGTYTVSAATDGTGTDVPVTITNYKKLSVPGGTVTASAAKGTVSNHSITITPSAAVTGGWVSTSTGISGTAVTVTASELVSGIYTVTGHTHTGTSGADVPVDITNYQKVSVPQGTIKTMPTDAGAGIALDGSGDLQLSISNTGLVTATANKLASITPVKTAGWLTTAASGLWTISGSKTLQLTTQAATTYTPTTTDQTIAASTYLTGAQTIKGDSNLIAGNIKSGVSMFGVTGSYVGGTVSYDETDNSAGGKTVTITFNSGT